MRLKDALEAFRRVGSALALLALLIVCVEGAKVAAEFSGMLWHLITGE